MGAIFPTTEYGTDAVAIRDWAQAAENLGYSNILLYDHVLGAEHANRTPALTGPYTEKDEYHEVFVTLGFMAGVTTTIGLSTGVLVLPQRQTTLVAKQAAELDLLSGERLRLGVGTGWNYVEYESLGENSERFGASRSSTIRASTTASIAPESGHSPSETFRFGLAASATWR
jgi:alkanesulfonate monooxygenase SsuD/methylene tetrahydromethanopterin reductase-like flavin-dependent oxidoreductase (luciferase family)